MKIGVGLYGTNGHQIQHRLLNHPHARLVATAAVDAGALPEALRGDPDIRHYATLAEMLANERVRLVSLCAPRRRDQAGESIPCLEASRHVYDEKPCATTEADLDALLAAARRTGMRFHEMAGTALDQPYLAIRRLVQTGILGTVVQVFAQKSYPYHDRRPQDEDVDGGLTCQAGVHALRLIEHVAGQQIASVQAVETRLGNPHDGGLRIASSMAMRLANGGVATAIANYLNQKGMGRWGNDHLRIFGTLGFLESVDGGARTRLVIGEEDRGPVQIADPGQDYFDLFAASLVEGTPMPFPPEEEVHPTRMVLRAKQAAMGAR